MCYPKLDTIRNCKTECHSKQTLFSKMDLSRVLYSHIDIIIKIGLTQITHAHTEILQKDINRRVFLMVILKNLLLIKFGLFNQAHSNCKNS